jgi:hypothetical protein
MYLRIAIGLAALAALAALASAPEAVATIEGPCQATISEEDVVASGTSARSDAIPVPQTGGVPVIMTAERPMERLKVEIEFAGVRYVVHDEPATGTEWTSVVPVDEYAIYGIGLYKVIGTGYGEGFTCKAEALVDVQGNPLETAAGAIGTAMVIVGGLGVLSFALRGGRTRVAPFFGAFLGLVFAGGVGVLLQQYGLLYPTRAATIGVLAAGLTLGFIAGLLGSRAP